MGRRAKIWQREDRKGFYATIGGRQRFLGLDQEAARKQFHLLKGGKDDQDSTLGDLRDAYLAQAEGKPTTIRMKTFFCDSFVSSVGKGKRVSNLKPHDIESWYKPTWNSSSRNSAIRAVLA